MRSTSSAGRARGATSSTRRNPIRRRSSCRRSRMSGPSSGNTSTSRKDRKSTRLNSSHSQISYAVFCLKKKNAAHHKVALDDHDGKQLRRNRRPRDLVRPFAVERRYVGVVVVLQPEARDALVEEDARDR